MTKFDSRRVEEEFIFSLQHSTKLLTVVDFDDNKTICGKVSKE